MKKIYVVGGVIAVVLIGAIVYLTSQNEGLKEDVETLESQQRVTNIVPANSLQPATNDSVTPIEDSSESSSKLDGTETSEEEVDDTEQVTDNGIASESLRVVNQSFLAAFYGTNDNRIALLKGFMTETMYDEFGAQNADTHEGTESEILDMSSYYGLIADGRCQVVNLVPMKNHEEENTVLMTVEYQLIEDNWKVAGIQFDLLAKLD